jgi:hypothetical protein
MWDTARVAKADLADMLETEAMPQVERAWVEGASAELMPI